MSGSDDKTKAELDVNLHLTTTESLRKAKRRMERSFIDDYCCKMKQFKREERPEYIGEYTFIVRVGVDDDNTVEIKDNVTTCKLSKIDELTMNL